MKRLTFTLITALLPFLLFPQGMQIQWQQSFGGTSSEGVFDMISTPGGYLIAGVTSSNDGNISFTHGGSDAQIVKINKSGEFLWEKTFGGSDGDTFRRIFKSDDNSYYAIGSWYIEATSNYTYGDASFDEDVFIVDSGFIEVPLTNNQILMTDVQVAYDQVIDSLSEHCSNIAASNKQLIVADISLKETSDNVMDISNMLFGMKILIHLKNFKFINNPCPNIIRVWINLLNHEKYF